MYKASICAIFKNEGKFLLEWVAFHKAIGFEHFYLYDNGSDDGGAQTLLSSAMAPFVTINSWPIRPGQLPAYRHFLGVYGSQTEWVAFIDLDEFIHPIEDDTILPLLERARNHSAVLLNWLMFGPSGHDASPEGLTIDVYNQRFPFEAGVHRHVKTVAKTDDVVGIDITPHVFRLKGEVCNAQGESVSNVAKGDAACFEPFVINHYWTRSAEDWNNKVARGRATTDDARVVRKLKEFEGCKSNAIIVDDRIRRFVPIVQKAFGSL